MTEAGWTREKPTVSGLYWLRNNPKHAPEVVRVSVMSNSNVTVERIGSCDVTFEPDNAEFKGPLTPDSYQQGRVAGLNLACIAVSQFSSDGEPIDANELRIALVQLLGELAKQ